MRGSRIKPITRVRSLSFRGAIRRTEFDPPDLRPPRPDLVAGCQVGQREIDRKVFANLSCAQIRLSDAWRRATRGPCILRAYRPPALDWW
jgi:hypothetical protein